MKWFCWILLTFLLVPFVFADSTSISLNQANSFRDGQIFTDGDTIADSNSVAFLGDDGVTGSYYSFFDFNTSTLPSGSSIDAVWIQLTLTASTAHDINASSLSSISGDLTDANLRIACQDDDRSNLLVGDSGALNAQATSTAINVSLGSAGASTLESQLASQFFSICLKFADDTGVTGNSFQIAASEHGTAAFRPVLWVNYTSSSLFSSQANLTLNGVAGNISVSHTQNVTAIASGYNVTSGTLYRNGTNITSQNATSIRLAAGIFNYTFVTEGNATHSGSNVTYFVNVSQTQPPISLVYGSLEKNFSSATPVRGSTCPDQIVCLLYRNNTLVANVTLNYTDPAFLGVGTYAYVFNTTGNENYTARSVAINITINPIAAPITLTIGGTSGNVSLTTGDIAIVGTNSTTVNGSSYVFDTALYINGNRTSLSTTQAYEVGVYNITLNTTGVSGNFTDNSINYTLTVTSAPLPNGGGGSLSRYSAPATQEDQECREDWICELWGACENGVRSRTCYEANSCGTTKNKPQESTSCTVEIPIEEEEPIIQAVEPNIFGEEYDESKGDSLSSIVEIECANGDECREFDELLAKWERLNISDKVNFNKEVVFDEARNVTRAKLFVEANEDLEDFKYYQSIPSCMALYARFVNFSTPPTQVLNEDPLMVWEFEEVTRGEILDFSFEVAGEVSEDCLLFLKEVFYEDAPLEEGVEKSYFKNFLFWISLGLIVAIIGIVSYALLPKDKKIRRKVK